MVACLEYFKIKGNFDEFGNLTVGFLGLSETFKIEKISAFRLKHKCDNSKIHFTCKCEM